MKLLTPVIQAAALAQGDGWNLMTAEQIFAPLPPYPWLVKGLHIAPGRITLLNGYADVGKTVIAMTLALAVASGRPVWGVFDATRSGTVLHLNGEIGSYIARERYQRLARGMQVNVEELIKTGTLKLANYPEVRLDDEDFESRMRGACRGCVLVIIDSLRAFSGALNENAKEIGVALLMLARVSEATGATIVVLHHNRKPSKDDVGGAKMAISGSSSILGGSECAFVMAAETKGGPILVQHERSPVGRPLKDFGLRIEDVDRDGDLRWGLRVVHLDPEQMAKADADTRMAQESAAKEKASAAILKLLGAHAGAFRGSREELRAACRVGKQPFVGAMRELVASGDVVNTGTNYRPEWILSEIRTRTNADSSVF